MMQFPNAAPELDAESKSLQIILSIVGEIWKTTCISIVRDQGHQSERAMMCFVTLHFLLLCLAEEHPGLRPYAVATVRQFLDLIEREPTQNLKTCVPDLGRFLVLFLLTEQEIPLRANAGTIMRELFNRNVRWVDTSYWATRDASDEEREAQVDATFEASQFGLKLTAFQSYYILRSAELGLNSLSALEACSGRPAADVLQSFQADYTAIKEIASYPEFFVWLQRDDLLEVDSHMLVHEMLCDAVVESDVRGYNAGVLR